MTSLTKVIINSKSFLLCLVQTMPKARIPDQLVASFTEAIASLNKGARVIAKVSRRGCHKYFTLDLVELMGLQLLDCIASASGFLAFIIVVCSGQLNLHSYFWLCSASISSVRLHSAPKPRIVLSRAGLYSAQLVAPRGVLASSQNPFLSDRIACRWHHL